jgi:hypothetical protein
MAHTLKGGRRRGRGGKSRKVRKAASRRRRH